MPRTQISAGPTTPEADYQEDLDSGSLRKYERAAETANLAERLGNTSASQKARSLADKIREKYGLDTSGVDEQGFDTWESMGPGSADNAVQGMIQMRRRSLARSGVQGDDLHRRLNRYGVGLNKSIEGQMKQGLIQEIDPSLERAQSQADKNLGTPAYSATDEQNLKSRIVSQLRGQASTRMARISSGLGISGGVNSPAAMALAQQSEEDLDSSLVGALRDTDLRMREMNRQQNRMDIDLATRIAAARYSILNGDSRSIIGMRGDIASMLDSLYSRDRTMELQKKAIEEGVQGPSQGGSIASGALSGAASGAVAGSVVPGIGTALGAVVGGVAGAAGGYMSSRQ